MLWGWREFTSYSNDINIIYGINVSNDKVGIKVCSPQSGWTSLALT